MSPTPGNRDRFRDLREKAERILREGGPTEKKADGEDVARLIHELEVHQTELEVQNEELRRAQAELEASRDRFADLYESAPVGYVTLTPKGLIEVANRAAHELAGQPQRLEGRPFSSLVHDEDLSTYYGYFNQAALRHQTHGSMELRLRPPPPGETPRHVRLEASLEDKGDPGIRWRLALVDVTEQKRMERKLMDQAAELEEQVRERTLEIEQARARAEAEAESRRRLAGRLVDLLEQDRRMLSYMLHDEVGQELSGAKMEIENAQRDTSPDSKQSHRLGRAARILGEAIVSLRNTSRELRPPSLDVLGLVPALRSLGRGTPESCRVRHFFKDVPEPLDRDLRVAVFRIAQEAVTNALRHSGCSEIHLSLTARDDTLHLTVEDDGCGFVWEKAVSNISGEGPLGLLIMRERAVFAGGSLEVDSTPERGTLVTAKLPLSRGPGEAAPRDHDLR